MIWIRLEKPVLWHCVPSMRLRNPPILYALCGRVYRGNGSASDAPIEGEAICEECQKKEKKANDTH